MRTAKLLLAIAAIILATPGCKGNAKSQQEAATTEQTATDSVVAGVKEINKDEFKALVYDFEKNPDAWTYAGDKPAIVDFYATWCGPCKALAPIMEQLAADYAGQVNFYKIDVDKEKELAAAFGVRSIPTLLWIPATGEPFVSMGMQPKEELKKAIDERLLKAAPEAQTAPEAGK